MRRWSQSTANQLGVAGKATATHHTAIDDVDQGFNIVVVDLFLRRQLVVATVKSGKLCEAQHKSDGAFLT